MVPSSPGHVGCGLELDVELDDVVVVVSYVDDEENSVVEASMDDSVAEEVLVVDSGKDEDSLLDE